MLVPNLLEKLFPHRFPSREARCGRNTTRGMRNRRRRAQLEALENRDLLAAVVVNTSADETDGGDTSSIAALIGNPGTDGMISLREAILASNNTPGANTITFDPSLAGQPIVLAQGELTISNAVTITGLGASNTTLDAQRLSRIFDITAAAGAVTLDGLTLQNGFVASADGGAVYSASALTVKNSEIVSNISYGEGSGIFALGDVTVSNSSIEGNSEGSGAGIDSVSGAVTIGSSTVFDNNGGIVAEHGPVTVNNSTIYYNYGFGIQAGTLATDGPVTIRSSIVAGDYADLSYGSAVPVTVSNSLIGDNFGSGLAEAPVGAPDSNGNFVGGPVGGAIDPGLQYGTYHYSNSYEEDLIGRQNGGPTRTLMLLPGSPAIDTGANPDHLATDQRGAPFARTAGGKTDMGAFELQTSQFTPTLSLSAPSTTYGHTVSIEVAGVDSPAAPDLESVPVTTTYYAGSTASGTPLLYPPYELGTYTVVGNFAGSAEYSAASLTATFAITQAPTTITVLGNHQAVFGQNASIYVKVTADSNAGVIDTGVITLWDGATALFTHNIVPQDYTIPGSVLSGNSIAFGFAEVAFPINGFAVGAHTLTATYSGGPHHLGSASTAFSEVIDQASTTTFAFSAPDPSVESLAGQAVTLTAYVGVVSPGAGAPTGSVTFWDGATFLGTGTVETTPDYNSYYYPVEATFTTDGFSIGAHNITATYGGDTNFKSSSSTNDLSVAIRPAETVTVTSSAVQSTASYGQNVTLTANVSVVSPDVATPTGTVQFQMDGQDLGSPTAVDANGNASITTSSLPLGNHQITAVYSGNTAIDTSTGFLPGTISTFAGNGTGEYVLPTPANKTVLLSPNAVATDKSGDLFIADGSQYIRRLDAKTGIVSTFGPTVNLNNVNYYPAQVGLVCDAAGNLFIADPGDNVVEKVSPAGIVTILAGTFGPYHGFDSGDGGPATAATLGAPSGLAFDSAGDLFIADADGGSIREINTAGIISTVAGGGSWFDSNGNYVGIGDGGPATSAVLNNPTGIAVDAAGNLYISDVGNYDIRKVDHATGTISTIVDQIYAQGLAVDATGDLFFADTYNQVVSEVTPAGVTSTIAGISGSYGYSGDRGNATAALLSYPTAVAFDTAGELLIADSGNNVIREINTTGTISTIAGGGALGNAGDGGPATQAPLDNPPSSLAVDTSGDLFIAEPNFNVVREVTPAGIITTVAGSGGGRGYSGDGGPATSAQLARPDGLAIDVAGDLFIADAGNNVIRKVTPKGIITTVAGDGAAGYSGDGGSATSASLNSPGAIAVDAAGDLFIADAYNQVIRKVSPAGIITTVATGYATGLATDAAGDLFIAEGNYYGSGDVREVSPTGAVTFIAGASYVPPGTGEGDGGPATAAALYPGQITFDAAGNLLIADTGDGAIRSINPAGIITTVAGGAPIYDSNGNYIYYTGNGDGGPATSVRLYPVGIAVDAAGDMFITDDQVIRKVSPSLVVTQDATTTAVTSNTSSPVFGQDITLTVSVDSVLPGVGTPAGTVQLEVDGQDFGSPMTLGASGTASLTTSALPVGIHTITAVYSGSAQFQASTGVLASGTINTVIGTGVPGDSGDGGPAIDAQLNILPEGLAFDSAGNLYIADLYNQVVRKVSPDGTITTVAGNGTEGYSGDGGLATAAEFDFPFDVAVDSVGDLFIDDVVNNVVREIFPNGIISTVAGDGTGGYSGDGGYATDAELYRPGAIAVDQFGDLFIADSLNNVIREVTPDGIIHTVVGNGTVGYSGDCGAATDASLAYPADVKVDAAGDLFFSDYGNNVVREVHGGIISTVAGNGAAGFSGDGGSATTASLNGPSFLALDPAGDLFVCDTNNNVVREVRAGIISTVAGTGTAGYTGDGGPAAAAELNGPAGVAVDVYGDLFISDSTNNVIREVTPTLIVSQATPTINWPTPIAITYGAALSATQLDATSSSTVGGTPGTVAGTFTYSPAAGAVLAAGQQTLTVTFTPTDTTDYATVTGSATLVVKQATPTINWATPAAITYGTALSGTQLDAASSWTVGGALHGVAGTFTYTPVAGTILGAGNKTLTVTFTPTDAVDYATATASVTLVVKQATPTINWATPAAITYGTALSGTQLDATSSWTVGGTLQSVAGAFNYTPVAGTILGAGSKTLNVTFSPTDSVNYATATASVTLVVKQATTAATVASSANPSVYGQPVVFTATVMNASNSGMTPPGSVQFVVDGVNFGNPVALDATGHAASSPMAFFTAESHNVSVRYLPANSNFASNSGTFRQSVKSEALESDPFSPGKSDLFVGGTSASNHAQIGLNKGQVTVDLHDGSQPFQTPLAGLNALVVYGQGANENIEVENHLTLPAFLFGGNGGNVHIQAGGGPTVEVGGSGPNNLLEGGPVRDLLIAGQGGGHLVSHGGQDILIGGYTDFDNNLAALEAIMTEWGRTDLGFSARVSHLLGPAAGGTSGGLNGGYYLNASTVHDDGISDHLEGGNGTDWYFAKLGAHHADNVAPMTTAEKSYEVGISS